MRDLVPFVQFKKREKHPCRSVNFSKVAVLPISAPYEITAILLMLCCYYCPKFWNNQSSSTEDYLLYLLIWTISIQFQLQSSCETGENNGNFVNTTDFHALTFWYYWPKFTVDFERRIIPYSCNLNLSQFLFGGDKISGPIALVYAHD